MNPSNPRDVDPLMDAIATQSGEYAVNNFGQHLPKDKQLKLWKRHYDSALASLIAYRDITQAQRVRALAIASVN